jgi:hypothetical protein
MHSAFGQSLRSLFQFYTPLTVRIFARRKYGTCPPDASSSPCIEAPPAKAPRTTVPFKIALITITSASSTITTPNSFRNKLGKRRPEGVSLIAQQGYVVAGTESSLHPPSNYERSSRKLYMHEMAFLILTGCGGAGIRYEGFFMHKK